MNRYRHQTAFSNLLLLCLTVILVGTVPAAAGPSSRVRFSPSTHLQNAANDVYLPLLARPALSSGFYEESSSLITFDGAWEMVDDSRASGGRFARTTQPGATVSITFAGDSLMLYRRVGPDGGRVVVRVDGQWYGSLTFHFVEERFMVPLILDDLGAHQHTVELELLPPLDPFPGSVLAIDAFTLPAPFPPSAVQGVAVARLNEHRAYAGIPLVKGHQAVHQAAQSHARFVAAHADDPRMAGLGFHNEHPDLAGFTGENASNRAGYFGYPGSTGEVGHFFGDPVAAVDGWMATVYHRYILMIYYLEHIGYGGVNEAGRRIDVLNTGTIDAMANLPAARAIYTYPGEGQHGVPPEWNGGEIPDPLPWTDSPVGYPSSLHIAHPGYPYAPEVQLHDWSPDTLLVPDDSWSVSIAELRDPGGTLVPAYVLDRSTDPASFLPANHVFLIAKEPLHGKTTYAARVAGMDSRGNAFDHTWHFTTR